MEANKYLQLTLKDRIIIEKMYKNSTVYEIAERLGKNYSTISRELKRLPKGQYSADAAQDDFINKKKKSTQHLLDYQNRENNKKDNEIASYLREHPDATLDQIAVNLGKTRRYVSEHLAQAKTLV